MIYPLKTNGGVSSELFEVDTLHHSGLPASAHFNTSHDTVKDLDFASLVGTGGEVKVTRVIPAWSQCHYTAHCTHTAGQEGPNDATANQGLKKVLFRFGRSRNKLTAYRQRSLEHEGFSKATT